METTTFILWQITGIGGRRCSDSELASLVLRSDPAALKFHRQIDFGYTGNPPESKQLGILMCEDGKYR